MIRSRVSGGVGGCQGSTVIVPSSSNMFVFEFGSLTKFAPSKGKLLVIVYFSLAYVVVIFAKFHIMIVL